LPQWVTIFIWLAGGLFAAKMVYALSVVVVLPITRGALYVCTSRKRVTAVLDTLALQSDRTLIDLGCGDGRLLTAASRRFHVRTVGYEINPLAYAMARLRCLGDPRIEVCLRNFWKADLSTADVVFGYLYPDVMADLARKLHRELRTGAVFVSCNFPLPGKPPERVLRPAGALHGDPIYIYRY
jgi:SAM-dependent methyltransferase